MEPGEVLEIAGAFFSHFAALAIVLTVAWFALFVILSTDVRVLRLAVGHRPDVAIQILRRAHRAFSGRPRATLVDDLVHVAVAVSLTGFSGLFAFCILLGREQSPILILLAVCLAHVLGFTGLLRAYGWLGGRESRFGLLPPPIPRTAGWTIPSRRREAAVNLYLARLHRHVMLAAFGGATLTYLAEASADARNDPELAESAAFGASMLLVLGVVGLEVLVIRRLTGHLHALSLIATALNPRRPSKRQQDLTVEQSRRQIAAIAAATERYAHHLHHKQDRHPNAHLLGLEVALLRAYLATFDSLTVEHPAEITRSLRRIAAVLMGGKLDFLRATQAKLAHLTDDVAPPAARRAWAARLSDAVDVTDRTSKLVGLLISLGALVLLVLANKASIQDLAPWLPWE